MAQAGFAFQYAGIMLSCKSLQALMSRRVPSISSVARMILALALKAASEIVWPTISSAISTLEDTSGSFLR